MRLTKKKAIEISIELWTWLAETGAEYKWDWSDWGKYGKMHSSCAFCEYSQRQAKLSEGRCDYCSYYQQFGGCCLAGTPYDNWDVAETDETRKKYAGQFLEQLKELK